VIQWLGQTIAGFLKLVEIPWCHRASGIEGFEDMNKEQVGHFNGIVSISTVKHRQRDLYQRKKMSFFM